MATIKKCFSCFTLLSMIVVPTLAQLCTDFYDDVCPMALPTIKSIVAEAIAREPRMGASLIRLHFHDCFVNGCDGSILLDDTPIFTGEKTARPNANSVRGFDVIDEIKAAVNLECLGNVVSCADILAVAARDSVVELRGASYDVLVGRRDSLTASKDDAEKNMPTPFDDFDTLLAKFRSQGLTLEDLVILSGAHTVGFARCTVFRSRIYNETATIDSDFARSVQMKCPLSGGDNNLTSLDESAASFDNVYFQDLAQMKGLLHSDQQLFQGTGSESDGLVQYYIKNPEAFWANFGEAMIKMGSISPLTGTEGEIRENCRVVNQNF